jgi:hypothetical protein
VILDNQAHQVRKERQDLKVLKDPEDFPDHKALQEQMERMEYKDSLEKEDLR